MTPQVVVRVEVFREGEISVGLCPDLDVQSLREALDAFIEECRATGTPAEVLEEAGFAREGEVWLSRQPIAAELVSIG